MDVLDFISRNGQRTVTNPNYNPKSKKNTEPQSIIVPDIQQFPDEAVEMARRDALNQFSIASNEADKYRRFGLNYNRRENMDSMLAERQSNWSKLTNALGQTLVSEVLLGTAKGLSDLVDFVGQIHFHDHVQVTTHVDHFGTKSLSVKQQVMNIDTGQVCATCRTVMSGYSRTTHRSALIPDTIKERILRYEEETGKE